MSSLAGIFYICEYLGIAPHEFFDLNAKNPSHLNIIIDNLKTLDDMQLETIDTLIRYIIK